MTAASNSMLRRGRTLGISWEAAAVALCLPPIFLHVRYQPGLTLALGGTNVNAYLSDFAVAAIVAVAIASGVRRGFAPLRHGRWVWATALAFLLWVFVEVALGRARTGTYPWHTHAVTAAKFAEYALLAPAIALVLRNRRNLLAPAWSLTLWSLLATGVALAQFAGAAILLHGRRGGRQGSFLVESDYSALAGAVFVIGVLALALPSSGLGRRLGVLALVGGGAGLILAGAVAAVIGAVAAVAAFAAVLVRRREMPLRRVVVGAAVTAIAVGGVAALRGGDIGSFAHFLGRSSSQQKTVQTYSQRTLLAWIGLQIWKDHPVLGAGWEASDDPSTFDRYVPAARRRFPNEPPLAFPTVAHPYDTQNVWVQALADLGVVGLGLLVALFAAAAATAWRTARRFGDTAAVIGLGWTALCVWLWAAQSFVAGIPLDAVIWIGFGLAATRLSTP